MTILLLLLLCILAHVYILLFFVCLFFPQYIYCMNGCKYYCAISLATWGPNQKSIWRQLSMLFYF